MQGINTTSFQKIQVAERFDDPDDGWSSALEEKEEENFGLEEKEEEEENFAASQIKDVIPPTPSPTSNQVVIQILEKVSVTSYS